MSQIQTGTVNVEEDSSLVIGNDTSWTTVEAGDIFIVVGQKVPYFIGSISPPEMNVSGKWELNLTAPYVGDTLTEVPYVICVDFSPLYNFVLVNKGDTQTDVLQRRNVLLLESLLSLGGGGGGGSSTLVPLTTLDIPTLILTKPSLWPKKATQDGFDVLEWWLLENSAPATAQDQATIDDPGSRWRKLS